LKPLGYRAPRGRVQALDKVKPESGFPAHDVEEGSARTVLPEPHFLEAIAFCCESESLRAACHLQYVAGDVAISLLNVVSQFSRRD